MNYDNKLQYLFACLSYCFPDNIDDNTILFYSMIILYKLECLTSPRTKSDFMKKN